MDRFIRGSQEPIDDEERELMDPDTWDWDNVIEGEPADDPGAVLTIRLTKDEFLALGILADEAGVGPTEFSRRTILQQIIDQKPRRLNQVRRPA